MPAPGDRGRPRAGGHRASTRQLRRERYHGLEVVGACLPPQQRRPTSACRCTARSTTWPTRSTRPGADTVVVLSCPELDGHALRRLAWQLERDDIDLIVASALIDVAGDRDHDPAGRRAADAARRAPAAGGRQPGWSRSSSTGSARRCCWCCSRRCCWRSRSASGSTHPARYCSGRCGSAATAGSSCIYKFRTHVPRRRGAARRAATPQRARRRAVQDAQRPAGHAGGSLAAPLLAGRAAAAVQRAAAGRCRWSGRGRRCRRRSRRTPTTCAAGSRSSPA